MKLIHILEKSKTFWSLIWLSLLFFFLRLPSLIEPNWYGDEAIYQTIGMALRNGTDLYTGIWDNKPPLLYLTYALFNGDQNAIRLTSLFVGMISVWLMFLLTNKLFNKINISIIVTVLYVILFSIPLTEGNIANAENFMLLPIIAAGLLIYKIGTAKDKQRKTKSLFLAGILLGIAFLFKIVAIFDFAAFLTFLIILDFPFHEKWKIDNKKLKTLLHDSCFLILGFLIPLLITILYFALHQSLPDFLQAAFLGNVGYVGYGNTYIIPQGFLVIKTVVLLFFLFLLAKKRSHLSSGALFVLIWVGFALFNALFSQRPYTHYVLVLLPSFCLLIGLFFAEQKKQQKTFFLLLFIGVLIALFSTFKLTNIKKTFLYYQNAVLFVSGQRDLTTYQAFFDGKTPRDYQLASLIAMHTKPNEPIFIWGDSPQIYVLSKTRPLTKYTVAYHIRQREENIVMTQQALHTLRPRYVIILAEGPRFPFKLDGYVNILSIDKAVIYEKIF